MKITITRESILEALANGSVDLNVPDVKITFKLDVGENNKVTNKKYEFTGESKVVYGSVTLRRIRRLSDGLVGGWIEKESNLSHEGNCFVSGDAQVSGNARVSGNAQVFDNARVSGNAQVSGNALVYEGIRK